MPIHGTRLFGTIAAMPVPWLQIVQLVPSIVDVSRELMKRTKRRRRLRSCRCRAAMTSSRRASPAWRKTSGGRPSWSAQMAEQIARS